MPVLNTSYDKYIVAFSGGKDSLACLLHLLEEGIDKAKIELWHHDIDGGEETFMDWECTPAYCRAIAAHFDIPIYFSWKEGGFKREMFRHESKTAPIIFEDENHEMQRIGGNKGKDSTRRRFPQVSPDLSVRWCSAYLKIDVCSAAIRNQTRFNNLRTLVLSGERGEESTARANYAVKEIDRSGLASKGKRVGKRFVDRWRPIRDWLESDVWAIIERWGIRPHPAYYLGWGRVSCKFCIFGNANQFASAKKISPDQFDTLRTCEKEFDSTLKRKQNLEELVSKGTPYETITDELTKIATSVEYNLSIEMKPWVLPAGAYGDNCGPT